MIRLRRLRLSQYKGLVQVDLAFPPRGSVLIEGLNEAGKSTLFDGLHFVLYGQPLVGDLAAALTYNAETTIASAVLDVDTGSVAGTRVDCTRLSIERRLRRTARTLRHEVQLWVQQAGGTETEYVRGVRAVRERLVAELGGLTAEALQNSCLVVQKALGRLETLSRREREGALSVLLNLDRLSEVERALRPTREHEDAVRRAEGIAGMAAVEAERITLRAQLEEQQRLAALVRLRDDLVALDAAKDQSDEATAERTTAERDLAAASARLEAISAYRTQQQSWRDLFGSVQRLGEAEQQLAATVATVEATEVVAKRLHDAKARAATAHDLANKVEAIRAAEERYVRLEREQRETQREVAACVAWRREQGEVAQRLGELEQTIAIAEARRAVRVVEERYARLNGAYQEAQGQVAACVVWRQEQGEVAQRLGELEQTIAIAEARRAVRAVEERYARLDGAYQEAQGQVAACVVWRREQGEVAQRLGETEQAIALAEEQREIRAERERLTDLRDDLQDWLTITDQRAAIRTARQRLGVAGGGAGVLVVALALLLVMGAPAALITFCGIGFFAVLMVAGMFAAVAGLLPGMSVPQASDLDARLQSTAAALYEQGASAPLTGTVVRQRLSGVEEELAALAGDGRGEVDEAGFRALLGQRGQLQRQGEELATNLEREPVLQATAQEAEAVLAACGADLEGQRAALAVRLGSDGDDGRGEVDEAGFRALLGQRGQLQRQGEELASSLEREPALQAAAQEAEAVLAACGAELEGQRAALVGLLGQDEAGTGGADGRGEVDEAGFQVLLGQRGQLQRQGEELASSLEREPALKTAAAQAGEALAACRADLDDQWPALVARLGRDYGRDRRAAEQAIHEQVRRAEQDVAIAVDAEERLPRERGQVEEWASRCQGLRERVERQLTALDSAVPADTDALGALVQQELRKVEAEIARLDPEQTAAAERDALERRGSAVERQEQALREGQRLAAVVVAGAGRLGVTLADVADVADDTPATSGSDRKPARRVSSEVWQRAAQIRAALPGVNEPLPPTEDVEKQISALRERLVRCDQDIRRIREDLALPADYVVPGAAEANEAASEARLELHSRRYAVQVLTQARRKMIANVLPSTEDNMCLLLPDLTAGRYRFASLDDDYRFQVWDERKQDYTEKKLLSGGTQDQFSLALRLGFAIAALPQEVGTRPGFLFLDEPLSSFDRDRTQALVNLLTRGTIASHFPQLFLISHSTLFDPHLFTYHVVMEAGGVASSTLPPPEPEAILPSRS